MNEQMITGYPSIDKPWIKYYKKEAINAPLLKCSLFDDCKEKRLWNYL